MNKESFHFFCPLCGYQYDVAEREEIDDLVVETGHRAFHGLWASNPNRNLSGALRVPTN